MIIFVADVHIRPDSTEDADIFIRWMEHTTREAQAVYILGDLFNYWFTGIEKRLENVLEALRAPKIHILPGNRDFLITNRSFSGLNILNEEEVILTPSCRKALVAHGHTLTRDDFGFKFLHLFGWPVLKILDRNLPSVFKESFAKFLVGSSAAIRAPRAFIEPDIALRKRVDLVICGHLHRLIMSERLIVLPSFFDSGQWLAWDENGPRILPGK